MTEGQCEAVLEIVRNFADGEPLYGSDFDGATCCMYCEYRNWNSETKSFNPDHEASCLWVKAATLIESIAHAAQ